MICLRLPQADVGQNPREIVFFRDSDKFQKIILQNWAHRRPFRQSLAGVFRNLKLLAFHCHRSSRVRFLGVGNSTASTPDMGTKHLECILLLYDKSISGVCVGQLGPGCSPAVFPAGAAADDCPADSPAGVAAFSATATDGQQRDLRQV